MDARTGKKIRRGRLFDSRSGRSLIVAYSHGVLTGPAPGLRTLAEMSHVTAAIHRADGLMVTPGLLEALEEAFIGRDRPSLVVHMDWQNFSRNVLPYREGVSEAMATVEEVVAAGADAIMTYLFVGQEDPRDEQAEVRRNAQLARACERMGLILIIEPRSAREKKVSGDKNDLAIMSLYTRMSAEIGADIIKCIYPGSREAMEEIVAGCPAPVLVAGGARKESVRDSLQEAADSIAAGAAGLIYGRNIYQASDPARALDAFRGIVHGGMTVDQALEILESA